MLSTHKKVTRVAGLLVVASFVFAACSSRGQLDGPGGRRVGPGVASAGRIAGRIERLGAGRLDALIAAAKAEGGLTTIALPRDWCNYGAAHRRLHRQVRDPDQRLNPGGGSGTSSRRSRPTRTTRARRRRTSSTSAWHSARRA